MPSTKALTWSMSPMQAQETSVKTNSSSRNRIISLHARPFLIRVLLLRAGVMCWVRTDQTRVFLGRLLSYEVHNDFLRIGGGLKALRAWNFEMKDSDLRRVERQRLCLRRRPLRLEKRHTCLRFAFGSDNEPATKSSRAFYCSLRVCKWLIHVNKTSGFPVSFLLYEVHCDLF